MDRESITLLSMSTVIYNSWIAIVALGYVYVSLMAWKILSPPANNNKRMRDK